MNVEEQKALEEEWRQIIFEIKPIMDSKIVEHDRIKDCTLKEEWRMDSGYTPFDGDMDHDIWKDSYEGVLEDPHSDLDYYRQLLNRCGLTMSALSLKYPRVAKLFAEHQE